MINRVNQKDRNYDSISYNLSLLGSDILCQSEKRTANNPDGLFHTIPHLLDDFEEMVQEQPEALVADTYNNQLFNLEDLHYGVTTYGTRNKPNEGFQGLKEEYIRLSFNALLEDSYGPTFNATRESIIKKVLQDHKAEALEYLKSRTISGSKNELRDPTNDPFDPKDQEGVVILTRTYEPREDFTFDNCLFEQLLENESLFSGVGGKHLKATTLLAILKASSLPHGLLQEQKVDFIRSEEPEVTADLFATMFTQKWNESEAIHTNAWGEIEEEQAYADVLAAKNTAMKICEALKN